MVPVEPVGICISGVALATLFSTCVDCFDYIDATQSFGRDYELLVTKLLVEKSRFLIWGESVGLLQTDDDGGHSQMWSPLFGPVIEKILNSILLLFTDTQRLTARYGLRECKENSVPPAPGTSISLGSNLRFRFKASYDCFMARIKGSQQQAGLRMKSRWAIYDRLKFSSLVDNLRQFIDGLYGITKSPVTTAKRTQLMKEELHSLQDMDMLGLVAEATMETHRDWSDVATEALGGSVRGQGDNEQILNWVQTLTLDRTRAFIESKEREIESEYQESLERLEDGYRSARYHFQQARHVAAMYVGQARTCKPWFSLKSGRREMLYSNELDSAVEVSQSLLDNTWKLQGLLAERDMALKRVNLERFRLEREVARITHPLQDSE